MLSLYNRKCQELIAEIQSVEQDLNGLHHSCWYDKGGVCGMYKCDECTQEKVYRNKLRQLLMLDFEDAIVKFKTKQLNIDKWNFCTHSEGDGKFSAYIMGEGAEQCLAYKRGFYSEQEIVNFFKSLGVKHILHGVG